MRRDPSLVPLSHQHHNALALCVMTDRALAADRSGTSVENLCARIVDRFDLEIQNHFELEEEILFPPLAALPMVELLLKEHDVIRAIVARIRTAADIDDLRAFTGLLRHHVRIEENELFEEAQRILPREELERMGSQFEARAVRVCL